LVQAQSEAINIQILSQERARIINLIDSLESRLQEVDHLLSQTDPEQRIEAMISKYGKNKGRMIAQGKVWPTISCEMAKDSWGAPSTIQKSQLSSGEAQKWTYPDNKYLYFKHGRLESWSE
jgi:hypothetical protein